MEGSSRTTLERLLSRNSHSQWWDSHISPKNSEWLTENLEKMDLCAKEMLKLLEEEGDSFTVKANLFYDRLPKLKSFAKNLYDMYFALAGRYDHVTGELRKNLQPELDSDPDDTKEGEKCSELAKDHALLQSRVSILENDLLVANEKLQVLGAEATSLQLKLNEKNAELVAYESKVVAKLKTQVSELEVDATIKGREIEKSKGVIADNNKKIENYERQLADASEKSLRKSSQLEADVVELEAVARKLREDIKIISQPNACLGKKLEQLEAENAKGRGELIRCICLSSGMVFVCLYSILQVLGALSLLSANRSYVVLYI